MSENDVPHSSDILGKEQVHVPNSSEGSSVIRSSAAGHRMLTVHLNHNKMEIGTHEDNAPGSADSPDLSKKMTSFKGLIDTAAPFESVKQAVSKFGGIVDWKAHKAHTIERRKHAAYELENLHAEIPQFKSISEAAEHTKACVVKELDNTKRLVEELKLNLEKAQTEEAQATQDSELAELRAREIEQGITSHESFAARAQLDIANARHEAAVAELKAVREELDALREEHTNLVGERDTAIKKAEEATKLSKEIEKTVEDLTLELMTAKESLEAAHVAHLEAEELRLAAALEKQQDSMDWEKELKKAELELEQLNVQVVVTNDLRSKLEAASATLSNLKMEFAAYMETKLGEETSLELTEELEEVKTNLEKAKEEVNYLRVAASSLKTELDREKEELTTIRQKEAMTSDAVASLQAELNRAETELDLILTKEKEAVEKNKDLPKVLQQLGNDVDQAKSLTDLAHEELRKAKEEVEQAKSSASTMDTRLQATLKEIEAAKASEKLALYAIKALEESEQAEAVDSPTKVTIQLQEYYELSKRANEAEELANKKVIDAVEQIKLAKKSESKCLERLEEATRKLKEQKEELRVVSEKADEANEGKLAVEQELRNWRAEHEEQRRKATDTAQTMASISRPPPTSGYRQRRSFGGDETTMQEPKIRSKLFKSASATECTVPELTVRKKKSFFPRFVMFLARKKAQSLK